MYRHNDRVFSGWIMNTTLEVRACKSCQDNYFIEDLIYGDRGNNYLICQDCYNYESQGKALCGDHLVPVKDCGCLR